jgi:hypothetical protein
LKKTDLVRASHATASAKPGSQRNESRRRSQPQEDADELVQEKSREERKEIAKTPTTS